MHHPRRFGYSLLMLLGGTLASQAQFAPHPKTIVPHTQPAPALKAEPIKPPVAQQTSEPPKIDAPAVTVLSSEGCSTGKGLKCHKCEILFLQPWKCEELNPKPAEKKQKCHCGWHGILWCPKEEEKDDKKEEDKKEEEKKNGDGKENGKKNGENGEKKNGENGEKKDGENGEKKNGNGENGEKKNGNGENGDKKEEEKAPPTPLMAMFQCAFPGLYSCAEEKGIKAYGWLQGGYTFNFDSPRDRLNFGTNYNNRSNDFTFNQAYLVLEKAIDLDKKKHEFQLGFRVDFMAGHDAPYYENFLGVFDDFKGDRLEFSKLTDIGISLPQFYADIHLPVLTDRGVDLRVGRFYTPLGCELEPAPQSFFYSHNYEFFYGMAFTHLGAMGTVHIGDTLDVASGIVRGWDVAFDDTNDKYSYLGSLTWNSCDKKNTVALAWCFGPEQLNNNQNNRSAISAYYTRIFGCKDQWKFITGGHVCWEQNATLDTTSIPRSAEWYGTTSYLFYTVDPRLTLGLRGEWFRDDDGARTLFFNSDNGGALWNRPGYAGNFYEITAGATWRPYKNLRIRPEVRFDWFDGAAIDRSRSRPFNDQRDNYQITSGFDVIYEF